MSSFLKKRIGSNARRDEWYAMNSERSKEWYVYIVSCSDGTYYTGITTNIARRINEHNYKISGAKYTRSRRPVKLITSAVVQTRSEALKLELKIKSLKKSKKIDFLNNYRDNNGNKN